jgi:transposase InsO family protein
VLAVLDSERFVDRAPAEVVATLLDEEQYLCSERTMYRLLAGRAPVRDRRNQLRHPEYAKPELLATAPNQVWSWDITKLLGPKKWTYYYLYVVMDIYSRKAVGWMLADRENANLAGHLIEECCTKEGVRPDILTLHSDRGSPDDRQVHRTASRGSRRDPVAEPTPGIRRQPLQRVALQDAQVSPGLSATLPRHAARPRVLPVLLPLVQPRTPPRRHRHAPA